MKKLIMTLSLLLALGLSASGVAAQFEATAEAEGIQAPDMPQMEIEGAEYAYSRSYSVDFMTIMEDPEYDPEDTSAMMRSVSVQGIQFDSEDNANKFIDDSRDSLDEAMSNESADLEGIEASELEGKDVDGLVVTMDMPDVGIGMAIVIFADGDQVFQVTATEGDVETALATADAMVDFVLDADVQTDDVTFNEDGTSTGGVYDRMPTADDELVAELTSVMDMELLAPGGE